MASDPVIRPLAASGDADAMADRIVAVLQHKILSGKIPVGAWLRHSALAEEFGVSRTPVREALRILASQGIVTIRPNSGARVDAVRE